MVVITFKPASKALLFFYVFWCPDYMFVFCFSYFFFLIFFEWDEHYTPFKMIGDPKQYSMYLPACHCKILHSFSMDIRLSDSQTTRIESFFLFYFRFLDFGFTYCLIPPWHSNKAVRVVKIPTPNHSELPIVGYSAVYEWKHHQRIKYFRVRSSSDWFFCSMTDWTKS